LIDQLTGINKMVEKKKRWWDSPYMIIPAMILVHIGFAGSNVLSKVSFQTEGSDPIVFGFLRNLFATPVLVLLAYIFEGLPSIKKQDVPMMFLLGLFGLTLNQLGFLLAIYMLTPVYVAIFQPLCPVLTVLIAIGLKVEHFKLKSVGGITKIAGVSISAMGAILVVALKGDFGVPRDAIIGHISILVSIFSYSLYMVLQKGMLKKYPPLTVTAWTSIYGSLTQALALLGSVAEEDFFSRWRITGMTWVALYYVTFVSSIFCFAVTTWAVRRASSTLVIAFLPLQVVAVVIMTWLFFGYVITLTDLLGAVLVILGLFSVLGGNFYEERKVQIKEMIRNRFSPIRTATDVEFNVLPPQLTEEEEHQVELLKEDH